MVDAPDYTLLSDVNVVGSVTLDVNVVGSVTISTNITGVESGVTFDVAITSSTVTLDVNITNATVTLNVSVTNEVLQGKLAKPALAFNGENAYVEVPNTSSLEIKEAITVEVWAKVNKLDVREVLYSDWNWGADKRNVYFAMESDNRVRFGISSDGADEDFLYSSTTLEAGRWYHLVGVFDGDYMYIYINGELDASKDTALTSLYGLGDQKYLGRFGSYYLDGFVSIFRIYNRALSADEIKRNYNNPQSPVTSGLPLWYNLDEGSGDTAYDKSGNGNHGTIYNCVWVSEQGQVAPLLAVNIVAKQVTLDINITAQDIDIKIYTPSGRWTTASELISASSALADVSVSADEEKTLFSLTGRGRLMTLGILFDGASTDYDAYNKPYIRIYVDGETSPSIELNPARIDHLSGMVTHYAVIYGFNRVDYGTTGQVAYATALNPAGGLTWIYKNTDTGKWTRLGGFIKLDVEFMSSLDIKIYNSDTANGVYVTTTIFYGEYP